MSSLHHENILEDCFEVAMESFRINNKLRNIFGSASIISDIEIFVVSTDTKLKINLKYIHFKIFVDFTKNSL